MLTRESLKMDDNKIRATDASGAGVSAILKVVDQKKFPNQNEIMLGLDRESFIKELETLEFSDVCQVLANKKWPLDTAMCH
uniref:Uncharacterized protein n=1 Tax=Acrobeloides nanus TaxID=290746 RepID=A0A914CIV1_9BILA